jgi:hypothetical protein
MRQLDSTARIALRLASPPGASLDMYPSEPVQAQWPQSRGVRKRMRTAGMTEIVLVLPTSCVDQRDAEKPRQGLRKRGPMVEQLSSEGSSTDQQTV